MHALVPTLLELAKESGLCRISTDDQWEAHFDFCLNRGMCRVLYHDKEAVGFLTWYKTNDYNVQSMLGSGKYLIVATLYIREEHRHRFTPVAIMLDTITKLIKMGKVKDVKYLMWNRATRGRQKKWTILELLKTGGLKWVAEEALK